jgi:hypothetical protein
MGTFTTWALLAVIATLAVRVAWRSRTSRVVCAIILFVAGVTLSVVPLSLSAYAVVDRMDQTLGAKCDLQPEYCDAWLDGVAAVRRNIEERTSGVIVFMLGLL